MQAPTKATSTAQHARTADKDVVVNATELSTSMFCAHEEPGAPALSVL